MDGYGGYNPYGDLYRNPYALRPLQRTPAQPAASDALPEVTPEEESSLLGRVGEEALGGLAYVGKILDKTFGARAVRGLLGGRPREALSLLPLSDTLGLTREADTVHGTDLLAQAGAITPGDHGWENQLAGFAADVALDPAVYLGAGLISKVASGYGQAARGLGRAASYPVELLSGGRLDPFGAVARLGSGAIDTAGRWGRALFDPSSHGAWTGEGQGLAREIYDPLLRAGRTEANKLYNSAMIDLQDQVIRGNAAKQKAVLPALGQHAEGFAPEAAARLQTAGLTPGEVAAAAATVDPLAQRVARARFAENSVGAPTLELTDLAPWQVAENEAARLAGGPGAVLPHDPAITNYFPRALAPYETGTAGAAARSARLSGVSPFQAGREDVLKGVPGGTDTLNKWALDPALSGSTRTLTPLQAENQILGELTGGSPGLVPIGAPVRTQAEGLARYLGELSPEARQKGLFSPDVYGTAKARLDESARVVASGETVIAGAGRFARPVADLEKAGTPFVRVPDVLEKAGLTFRDPNGVPVAAERVLTEHLAGRFGLPAGPVGHEHLRNFGVPADVANDMLRIGQAWKTPEVLQPVVRAWDWATNLFKTGLTAVFPAFHGRNLMSNVFNMYRDHALDPTAMADAMRLVRGGQVSADTAAKLGMSGVSLEEASNTVLKEAMGNRVAFTRNTAASERMGSVSPIGSTLPADVPMVGAAAPRSLADDVGGWFGGFGPGGRPLGEAYNPLNIAGVNRETDVNRVVDQARKLGNTVEDWSRLSHYLAKRRAGATEADAAESVMKYQIDYSELTEFERNVMKRIFPWYTFSRRSLPAVLEDLATQPGRVATGVRLATGTREPYGFVPQFIGEGASIPVPGAPDGQQRYVSSFGMPFEDEAVKTLGSALHGDSTRTLQQLFGMAQPWIKTPAEVATNTQMFSGRHLDELRPYEFASLGGILPEDTARRASQVIANTPVSRFGSTLDKAIDDRKGTLPTALNFATGVRLQDVDSDRQRLYAAREALKKELHGMPGVRSREDVYIPTDTLPSLDPYQLQLYALLKKEDKLAQQRGREQRQGSR